MNEILELNSLLRSDDTEKIDLERQKISLLTAVEYQEARLLHEFDEVARLETDLVNCDHRLTNLHNEVLPNIQQKRKVDDAHLIIISTIKQCENFDMVAHLLCVVEGRVDDLQRRLESLGSRVFISQAMHRLKKAENDVEIMELCKHHASLQKLDASSRLEALSRSVTSLKDQLHYTLTSLNNLRLFAPSHDEKAFRLQQDIFEVKHHIHTIGCDSNDLLARLYALVSQVSCLSMDHRNTMNSVLLQWEKENCRLRCLQYMKFMISNSLTELQFRTRYFQDNCDQAKYDLISKEMHLKLSSTELRLTDEEQRLLSSQVSTLSTKSYFANLGALTNEIENLRRSVTESCLHASHLDDEVTEIIRIGNFLCLPTRRSQNR